jgi:CzcA family heavy metal efflux pump
MMRLIVGASLKFRFLVLAIAAAMMFFGMLRLGDMPVDVFPEFAPPRVEVQTEALGLSTTEVEALVSVPLEDLLNGIPGLDIMRSKSVPGLSSILMIFEPGTDLILARQLVEERLAQSVTTLPNVAARPIILQPLSATSRVMKIGISSKTLSLIDMSELTRFTIRPRLMAVPGVANVAVWGERKRQVQVHVDPERLKAHGLTLEEILKATSDSLDVGLLSYSSGAEIGTGGFIDTPNQRLGIRNVLSLIEPEDMSKVTIKVRDGKALRIGDVADVVESHPPMIGDGIINDGPGLLLIVEKFPWGNTLDVTRGVEDALNALRPGLPGMDIDSTIFRPATFIEISIENLTIALLIGCLLVMVVLFAFLFEWRTALISVVAIPLSLVAGGLVLYLRGATINTMVLAGFVIAVGVVVDDAIIDIENIVRRLRQHRKEGSTKSTASIILESSFEVRSAIIYATLIDVMTLLPIFFMEGLSGAFFQPLAISYALAVLASMLVAMTVTPALALILLRNAPIERRESPLVHWLQRGYDRVLKRIIRSPLPAFAAVGVLVLIGAAVMPLLGQSLLPDFKERDFLMHWVTQPGTSHPEMNRITIGASQELRAIPGVRNFGAHVGRAVAADEVVGMNFTENWISIDPAVDYDTTLHAVQETVEGYPGLYRDVQTYLKERIREVLTGASGAIVVRTFGPDLATLREKAEEVRQTLAGTEGLVDLHLELQVEVPQMEVKVDLAKVQSHGLKPGDVIRAASIFVNSVEVGDVFWGGKVFDVNVVGTPETRHSLTSVRELLIDTPNGGQVRLADVADVRVVPTPNIINRENFSRRIDVIASVRGRDLGSVARDVEGRLQSVQFPLGFHSELLGEYAERQAAQSRLFGFAIIAVIGVLFLLQASFKSWRLAILSFLTLPSALVGGVLAAYLGDGIISLGSLVGFFTVLGIAARNGIMLINHYQHLEQYEGETFGSGMILRGARERLAPILMTALATGLALVPLVVAGDIPGHEIEHPMAVVILGGLVTSTLLNLFIVPTLYLRFGKKREVVPAAVLTPTAQS